jgi:multidrug resistance efflux pump
LREVKALRQELQGAAEAGSAVLEMGRLRDLVAQMDALALSRADTNEKGLRGRVAAAESNVEMMKERAAWTERMLKRGYVSQSQAQADQARLRNAEAKLEAARQALRQALAKDKK